MWVILSNKKEDLKFAFIEILEYVLSYYMKREDVGNCCLDCSST